MPPRSVISTHALRQILPPIHSMRPRRWASTSISAPAETKPTLLVLGGGWAGYNLLQALDKSRYKVIAISGSTNFVTTPLLPSAVSGVLGFRDIIEPLQSTSQIDFYHAWAQNIDFETKTVSCIPASKPVFRGKDPLVKTQQRDARPDVHDGLRDSYPIKYDKLVIATGCYNQTFGTEGVKEHAYFLRDIESAAAIRYQIYEIMDFAKMPELPTSDRDALLSWIVVGGGPTGAELASELFDLAKSREFNKLYPKLAPLVKVRIVDAAPDILATFDKGLAKHAKKKFKREGLEVLTSRTIERVEATKVVTKEDGDIPCGLVVWSTGNKASPLNEAITGALKDKKQNLVVTHGLQLLSESPKEGQEPIPIEDVYALGDCAQIQDDPMPATAQVANQQAVFLAKVLSGKFSSSEEAKFTYHHRGTMTSIGGKEGLIQTPFGNEAGVLAWLAWRSYYWLSSISVRTKVFILTRWTWNAFLGRDTSRM